MANKIVKIPVADINGLKNDGSYSFRYRIKSVDGSRRSDWSELTNLSFPLNDIGSTKSFYELYVGGVPGFGARPILSDNNNADPHSSNAPYDLSIVTAALGENDFITSSITYAEDDSQIYTYSWTSLAEYPVNQTFDVYLSWKTGSSWSDWEYSGTTTSNSFSFSKKDLTAKYVQAAVFLSSYPKLTNIYGNIPEITFVSICTPYSTYHDASGTVGSISGTSPGPYKATITGLASVPYTKSISGRRVFGEDGTGKLGTGNVTVVSTNGTLVDGVDQNDGTQIIVTSPNQFTAGTVTDLRL
jgi:hypothetical protein